HLTGGTGRLRCARCRRGEWEVMVKYLSESCDSALGFVSHSGSVERIVVEWLPQITVVTVVDGHVDDADPGLRQRGFERADELRHRVGAVAVRPERGGVADGV